MTDTAEKRSASLSHLLGVTLPIPDGTIAAADRAAAVWVYFPPGGGGATTNVDLSLAITALVTLLNRINLLNFLGGSVTPTIVKQANMNHMVTIVGVAAKTFSVGKTLIITATATPVLTFLKAFGVLLFLTITGAVSITKRIGKVVALDASTALALARSVGRTFIVSVSGTLSLNQLKVLLVALSLTVTAVFNLVTTFIPAGVVTATKARLVGLLRGIGISGRP